MDILVVFGYVFVAGLVVALVYLATRAATTGRPRGTDSSSGGSEYYGSPGSHGSDSSDGHGFGGGSDGGGSSGDGGGGGGGGGD